MQCARCGPTDRKLNGRNLCSPCAQRSIRDGTYHDYPLNERVLAETKQCRGCGQTLPMESFRFVKRRNGGYFRSNCMPCESVQNTAARQALPDPNGGSRRWRAKLKVECLTHYSGGEPPRCSCCGIDRLVFLCLDHVNGGGTKHRKATSPDLYRILKRDGWPPGYRVLCWNCNHAAHINGGECGCQDE